jgi:putative oxidoreductase
MKAIVLAGRILFSLIFIMSGFNHFSDEAIEHAAQKGVPLAAIAVPLSGFLAIIGGLSIITGFKARIGALLIILFLVPVTIMMHDFWTIADPMQQNIQRIMFMKNLSILGGALMIAYYGSGAMSVDGLIKRKENKY